MSTDARSGLLHVETEMTETAMQKYQRIIGLISIDPCAPLLSAIAQGEWTAEDARALSVYLDGVSAERVRCITVARNEMVDPDSTSDEDRAYNRACEDIIAAIIGKDRGCDPPQGSKKDDK